MSFVVSSIKAHLAEILIAAFALSGVVALWIR